MEWPEIQHTYFAVLRALQPSTLYLATGMLRSPADLVGEKVE